MNINANFIIINDFCLFFRNVLGYKITGFPVRIDNTKYARNAYYFNLCFVCDAWARTVQYEPVVKKLSEYLVGIQVHGLSCFLLLGVVGTLMWRTYLSVT
jgi:hypothetical protein